MFWRVKIVQGRDAGCIGGFAEYGGVAMISGIRKNRIDYVCNDAKSTYDLYRHIEEKLVDEQWIPRYSLMDFYSMHMHPFAEVLTDMI